MNSIEKALSKAGDALDGKGKWPNRDPRMGFSRVVAVGDPQARAETFFSVLEHNNLLGDDGWLAPDVKLVSIGDHFDYGYWQPDAWRQGMLILSWLAAHPPEQVEIIFGNHDVVRVQDFINLRDDTIQKATDLAKQIGKLKADSDEIPKLKTEFWALCPDVPTPDLLRRDFNSQCEVQTNLVMKLLLAGRFRLATMADVPGVGHALVTHAGITVRELDLLGIQDERSARKWPVVFMALKPHGRGMLQPGWNPLRL